MDKRKSKKRVSLEGYFANMKDLVGVTHSQLVVSILLLLGLLIGAYSGGVSNPSDTNRDAFRTTLAEQLLKNSSDLKKSITGSDIQGETIFALADTKKKKKKSNKIEGTININTASKLELMKLPGIGAKTADKILKHRKSNPFSTPSDIQKIKGIGPKKFEKMKKYITV